MVVIHIQSLNIVNFMLLMKIMLHILNSRQPDIMVRLWAMDEKQTRYHFYYFI
jgi:hypothetical protein